MRIRRLELHGFKSFADRTVFHYGPGISCVVGPNGCGKSNVVDALKWVIGEQSAKSLRGGEMQDVIFAGSAERKPVGYAEVGLTFSAEDGTPFPGEYARYTEIQVARRLYRSGTSEYLINQTRCRRRDIVDLLMDSGVGNNLYSFIEQGRIDKIVSATPLERRSLIDEAAGITRYKMRRAEARSKLEATGGQLDRASDVAEEMSRRLRTLERQVLKAARFRRMRALVRQEEIFLGLVKYDGLATQRQTLSAELSTLRADSDRLEELVETLESDIEMRREEVSLGESTTTLARDALAELDAQRREVDATIGLHDRRCEELRQELGALREELVAERSRMTTAEEELAASSLRLEEVGVARSEAAEARDALQAEMSATESARAEALATLREVERRASSRAASRADATARVTSLRERVAELPGRLAGLRERSEAAEREEVVLVKRRAVADEALESCVASEKGLTGELRSLDDALDVATRKHVHTQDAVRAAEIEQDAAQRVLDEAIARVETTAGMAEEEVAGEVARAQRSEDRVMVEAERDDAKELAALEQRQRGLIADAESRARAWRRQAREHADADLAAWRAGQEAEFSGREAAMQAEQDDAAGALADALEAVEDEEREKLTQDLAVAVERRDTYATRVEEARREQQNIEARLAMAMRRRRELEGRIAAMTSEEAALLARDAGATAVREALGEVSRLVDVLEVPEGDRDWVTRALGKQLQLPVVQTRDEVLRAAEAARAAGSTSLVWSDDAPKLEQLVGADHLAENLTAALEVHASTGGSVLVRATGDRVERTGVVQVRSLKEEVDDALGRRAELESLRKHVEDVLEEERSLDRERTGCRAKVEASQIGLRAATEKVDLVEREGRSRMRARLDDMRAAGEIKVKSLRSDYAAWRKTARQTLEDALRRRAASRDEMLAQLRQDGEAGVAVIRQRADEEMARARGAAEGRREERRRVSEQHIDEVRQAAWKRVRAQTADVQVRREEARVEVERSRGVLDAARRREAKGATAVSEARARVDEVQRKLSEQRVLAARLEAEARAAVQQQQALVARRQSIQAQQEALTGELGAVRADLARAEVVAAAAAAASEEVDTALADARGAFEQADASLTNLRDRRDEVAGKLSELVGESGRLEATRHAAERRLREGAERVALGTTRIEELESRLGEARDALAQASRTVDELAGQRQEAAKRHESAKRAYDAAREAFQQLDQQLRSSESKLGDVQRKLAHAEQQDHQAAMEVQALRERLDERYQLDVAAALHRLRERSGLRIDVSVEARAGLTVAGKHVEPVEDLVIRPEMLHDEEIVRQFVERITEHRAKLGRLGDVNLTALEEYIELDERYQELDAQRGDLETSVAAIRSAIAKMNKTCRERFRDTFDRVDESFRGAYPDLVGGGEAHLSLTDEEDLLETGVEIFVRPPGKRLQNLGLLSGGEKAMTAIALLLALFTVKPSPFCVLDEVDAPLDEANGARFNDMLRHMSKMTQFIVITHNRKTMECADTLYGITMPTPGCSALVSVEVDD